MDAFVAKVVGQHCDILARADQTHAVHSCHRRCVGRQAEFADEVINANALSRLARKSAGSVSEFASVVRNPIQSQFSVLKSNLMAVRRIGAIFCSTLGAAQMI
jgi:hypothetical protein